MIRLIQYLSLLLLSTTIISCSSYNVKTCKENSSSLSNLKKSGIVIRIPSSSRIGIDNISQNIDIWTNGHKRINKLKLIKTENKKICISKNIQENFYQKSDNNKFLKFKSMGVITLYLNNNKTELKSLMENDNLDSLIIYEIDSAYSHEMQFVDFYSMIIIVNKKLEVIYSDYQSDSFESEEFEENLIKQHLMDKISGRILEKLSDLNYIKER